MNPSETLQTDVVVVGSGGAGLTAATVAAEAGANVILLESLRSLGGNTRACGGLFAVESHVQRRLCIDADADYYYRLHMEYTHWRTNGRLVRTLIERSKESIRLLEDKGCHFEGVGHLVRNAPPCFHMDPHPKTGVALVKHLTKACEDLGVRIFKSTRGRKLITDDEGKVAGIIATTKDGELKIITKSVIMASGGFWGNKEMVKKYFANEFPNLDYIEDAGVPSKGDGILMAIGAGADTDNMAVFNYSGPNFKPMIMGIFRLAMQPNTLWVNKRGERYFDESAGTRSPSSQSNSIVRQPQAMTYTLYDRAIKEELTEVGFMGGPTANFKGEKHIYTKEEIPELDASFQKYVERGNMKISDSWDEVAEWMGASPDVLKATVEEYNSFCDKGHDDIFGKDRKYLQPLRTPPFYAMECHMHAYITIGGIKVNTHMEAVDKNDAPIPGLYAAGTDTGGWEEDSYNYQLCVHVLGFSVTGGLIAGENAAQYVLGKGK